MSALIWLLLVIALLALVNAIAFLFGADIAGLGESPGVETEHGHGGMDELPTAVGASKHGAAAHDPGATGDPQHPARH